MLLFGQKKILNNNSFFLYLLSFNCHIFSLFLPFFIPNYFFLFLFKTCCTSINKILSFPTLSTRQSGGVLLSPIPLLEDFLKFQWPTLYKFIPFSEEKNIYISTISTLYLHLSIIISNLYLHFSHPQKDYFNPFLPSDT